MSDNAGNGTYRGRAALAGASAAAPGEPIADPLRLPDAHGDVSPALTARQLAFLALIAALLLTGLRRLRRRWED
jgi:hypothetical protein